MAECGIVVCGPEYAVKLFLAALWKKYPAKKITRAERSPLNYSAKMDFGDGVTAEEIEEFFKLNHLSVQVGHCICSKSEAL